MEHGFNTDGLREVAARRETRKHEKRNHQFKNGFFRLSRFLFCVLAFEQVIAFWSLFRQVTRRRSSASLCPNRELQFGSRPPGQFLAQRGGSRSSLPGFEGLAKYS